MLNALEIYNKTKTYSDIKKFIGMQESLFIDFKTSSTLDGVPTKDDKSNFKEAIAGFAHQEGGVIVWGINCRKNTKTNIDEAINEKTIPNVGDFKSKLFDTFPYTTEPLVDGVQSSLIIRNTSDTDGFLVVYIPKSNNTHRVMESKKGYFSFKRYGDKFLPVGTVEDIRSLLFRQLAPELSITFYNPGRTNLGDFSFRLSIKNKGRTVAKFVSLSVKFDVSQVDVYNHMGNLDWKTWGYTTNIDSSHIFMINNGFVLHPEQELPVFRACSFFEENKKMPTELSYTLYAEGMEPVSGIINFDVLEKTST